VHPAVEEDDDERDDGDPLHRANREHVEAREEIGGDGRTVVTDVTGGSLAEDAGLEPGDVITDLGGYSAFSLDQLRRVLSAGRPITLGVRRGSERLRLSLSLGELAA